MSPSFLHIVLFLSAALNLLIGCVALAHGPRKLAHGAFFVMTLGATLWIASFALIGATRDFSFNQYIFHGGTLLFAGFIVFARAFLSPKRPAKRFWLLLLPLAFLAAATPFDLFIADIVSEPGSTVLPRNGPLMPLYAAIAVGTVLYGLLLLWRSYRRATGADRTKFHYLSLGLGIFMGTSIIADGILPSFGIFAFNAAGPISSVFFLGLTAYAMVRHHLLDVRIVIQRGAIYTTLLAAIIGTFLALLFTLTTIYGGSTPLAAIASAALTAVIGIWGGRRIEEAFRRATDRFFFKDPYDYADALRELSGILNRHLDLTTLAAEVSTAIRRTMKTSTVRLGIVRENAWFENGIRTGPLDTASENPDGGEAVAGTTATVPITGPDGPVGVFSLGPKRSGDPYTASDMKLLATFADQAAVALEKSMLHAELQRHAENLEERVRERTAALRERQEQERQTMMDVAHAVQTPLTIMQGEVEAMKKPSRRKGAFGKIERSIAAISESVYALLRLAHLENADERLARDPVDLSALAADTLAYVAVVCREQKITLEEEIAEGIVIMGDRRKLEELITNLLGNAVRYMGPGPERRITMSLRRERGRIALRVEDTGRGIAPEDLPRIFDRFYRSPEAPSGGTGLGLAIAKRIAELHGASITAESAPDKGSAFTVAF